MTQQAGPCEPWATVADVCSPCDDYTFDVGILEDNLEVASELLFVLSGRQFPGECSATIRPCATRWGGDWFPRLDAPSIGHGFHHPCTCRGSCSCLGRAQVSLGLSGVIDVVEVRQDGAVVSDALYRLDDGGRLVRLPDPDGSRPGWPCCQRLDLADTEEGTFAVDLVYGRAVPAAGRMAAAALGCQLALACQPETMGVCRLPKRVQTLSRQGVTVGAILDNFDQLDQGKTGIYEVDLFIKAYNPKGLRRRATVVSPDTMGRHRRVAPPVGP